MQFWKVISYKLRVFKMMRNILPFLCVGTPLQYSLNCVLKRLKTGTCLTHISPISKDNNKQNEQDDIYVLLKQMRQLKCKNNLFLEHVSDWLFFLKSKTSFNYLSACWNFSWCDIVVLWSWLFQRGFVFSCSNLPEHGT